MYCVVCKPVCPTSLGSIEALVQINCHLLGHYYLIKHAFIRQLVFWEPFDVVNSNP